MGKHKSSLKAWCHRLIPLLLLALAVNICQARGRDHKKRDDLTGSLASTAPTDGTSLSISTSELQEGRVVTRIVTTSILITLPCGASEGSYSFSSDLVTTQSSSHYLNTTRGSGTSLIQSSNSTIVHSASSSSFTNWNTTAVNHGSSSTVLNWNSTIAGPVESLLSSESSFQSHQPTVSAATTTETGNRDLPEPFTKSPSTSQKSQNGSSSDIAPTSSMQTSLSEGGTAQTSGATTGPDHSPASTISPRPSQSSSSISSGSVSIETSISDVTTTTDVPQTSPSGTDHDAETSSMSGSVSSGGSAHATTTSVSTIENDQQSTLVPIVSTEEDWKSTKKGDDDDSKTSTKKGNDDDDDKSTNASPGSTQKSTVSSTHHASSTQHSATPTSTAAPGSSGSNGPSSTVTSSTSSEGGDLTTFYLTATIKPPEGVQPWTWLTWTSTEVTKTTTRDGQAWPTIFPAWSCIGGQLLCHPKCLIPFLFCDLPALNLPGPLGFPWAKPPPKKPKGKPRKVRKDDPTDPEDPEDDESEPSETPTSSSEASCTATTTVYPDCNQGCTASPIVGSDSSTSFTTSCNTATCRPSIVCSTTVETTTTTTIKTVSATSTESYCGGVDSSCQNCKDKRSGLSKRSQFVEWNPKPDPEILGGPDGLTNFATWPAGKQNWFDRAWKYLAHYCDGLDHWRPLGDFVDGTKKLVGYSTMHADVWGDQPMMGGTGPLWGCSGIIIITKRGIYTSHVWEVPNFWNQGFGQYDIDKEFREGVLEFLETGSGDRPGDGEFVLQPNRPNRLTNPPPPRPGNPMPDPEDGTRGQFQTPYPGIMQLKETTPIFDNIPEDTLQVIFIYPLTGGQWSNPVPPNYPDYLPPRHPERLQQWKDWVSNHLGFPADKFTNVGYHKGPGYWPNADENYPMDNYVPPYGLIWWQYHPAHVVEVLPDGTQIRKPTIKVYWETWPVYEFSWCPPGTELKRDENGSESCPMPAAPAKSSAAASSGSASASGSVPASASASAGSPGSQSSGQVSMSGPFGSQSPGGQSSGRSLMSGSPVSNSPSSKSKVVVWVTATAEVTVTNDIGVTLTVMPSAAAPTSTAEIWRIARITQDIALGDGTSNHTATVSIVQIEDGKEVNVVTNRDSNGGGPVKLPRELVTTDNSGAKLTISFKGGDQPYELKSDIGGLTQEWSMKQWGNKIANGPWCKIIKNTTGESVVKRSAECHYRAFGQ
ncbi:uncharacterized protein BDZ83DRAFT_734148 [Colletotrichum acutatum]|uniref:Uncharacterized protein n=1 Tax=Glomerella acutata TaxID=27357 RepID=A0AAD8XD85_GLOAC|nr:uncharacterized protein BDZ83DRAFT_734148 [Colletotrichum acutatum]KAK1716049.1 hypothetical protein BDZ83DRAFT_734148 [Colletotrichum acutatum]